MQDQTPYNVTPEQGWATMKPILDEVMPVNRPSRRYPFFWWSTALVVTGLVVFTLFNNTFINKRLTPAISNQYNQETNREARTNQSSVTDKIIVKPSLNKVEQSRESDGKTTLAPVKLDVQHVSSGSIPSKKSVKKNLKPVPMAMSENVIIHDVNSLQGKQNTDPGFVAENHQQQMISESADMPEEISKDPIRNGKVVEITPVIDVPAFKGVEQTDAGIPSRTVTKAKRQPAFIEPNLAVSGLAGVQGGLGIYGGAGINMNLGRRFGITASFGYMSYHPDAALLGGTKSLDANAEYNSILNFDPSYPGNEIYVNAESINNEAGYNAINPLIEKVTQWQMSAGLKWKMDRRLFMEGGVQVGLFTKAFSTYPIAAQDPLSSAPPAVRFENTLNDFDVIRSTTTSIYAGIGYRFGHHIDMFANWMHGLDQYILNESVIPTADQDAGERTDYIRGLSLGVHYNL